MYDKRSTPDEALAAVEAEERQLREKGHLKIFFGYASGVGKTYAMLKAAHIAKRRGIDVVVGYLEPHNRPQTIKLARGLERLKTLDISYQGVELHELDLDEALARRPQLMLVDELAHTNTPGCRHKKRYQDVEELLEAGIDVYTTLNVQHVESLNDIVASTTGVLVHERIPDRIFDDADKIELIDIEPEDLLKRLSEGRVYRPDQAERAMGHFFSQSNLVALREMAMRRTADHMNQKAKRARRGGSYFTDEHILACITSSTANQKVIRMASHLASAFHADFSAVVVEDVLGKDINTEQLQANTKLAEQLGAHVSQISGSDISKQVLEFARFSSVSKIIVGKERNRWHANIRTSLPRRLLKTAPDIDLVIVAEEKAPARREPRVAHVEELLSWKDAGITAGLLICATLVGFIFQQAGFSVANIITVYILAVLAIAVTAGSRWYSFIASALSVLAFNFFFTEPFFSLQAYDGSYPVTFIIMFAAAFITSTVAGKLKIQEKASTKKAYETSIMLNTTRQLQQAKNEDDILTMSAAQIVRLFGKSVILYSVSEGQLSAPRLFIVDASAGEGALEVPLRASGSSFELNTSREALSYRFTVDSEETKVLTRCLSEKGRAVAEWVFKNNRHAGAGTGTLNEAECLYLSIRGIDTVCGVIGIVLEHDHFSADQNNLCLAILNECGLVIERNLLRKKEALALSKAKSEELRANLMQSVSHDLRTPLTAIAGNASMLLKNRVVLDTQQYEKLCLDIYDDSMWLTNLTENLLAITRMGTGAIHIDFTPEVVVDVINEALAHVDRRSLEHNVEVAPIDEYLMARMDSRLIIQVIINLVNNAIEYTPRGSHIMVSAIGQSSFVEISVADDGPGIPDAEKLKIFDMFYTSGFADRHRGSGFGLFLCKCIVEAHGGTIKVEDNVPSGSVFVCTLPRQEGTIDR